MYHNQWEELVCVRLVLLWDIVKGRSFHGSRSYREMNMQNESCQMGGREDTATIQRDKNISGDRHASFCRTMSGREVAW